MIDWYVILFLAITLLIFHMKEFGEHTSPADYMQTQGKIPVSKGTISLLFQLITGTFLFIPFYFTMHYSYLSGLAIALSGGLILFLFSRKIESLNVLLCKAGERKEYFKTVFTKNGRFAFYFILFMASFEGLIVSILLACSFMESVFYIPWYWTSAFLLSFGFVFAGMGGVQGIQKVGAWLMAFFFIGVTMIPLTTYLIHGIQSTYLNFVRNNSVDFGAGSFILACFLFMLFMAAQLMVYFFISPDLSSMKKNRLKITVSLSAICWSAVPLSVTVIVVYLLSVTERADLLSGITQQLSPPLLYILIVSVLSSFALGIGISLHKLTSLIFMVFPGRFTVRKSYFFNLFLCLLTMFTMLVFKPTLYATFIFYLNFFVSLAFALWLLVKSNVQWGIEFSLILVLFVLIGCWVSFAFKEMTGPIISFALSGITLFVVFVRKVRKI